MVSPARCAAACFESTSVAVGSIFGKKITQPPNANNIQFFSAKLTFHSFFREMEFSLTTQKARERERIDPQWRKAPPQRTFFLFHGSRISYPCEGSWCGSREKKAPGGRKKKPCAKNSSDCFSSSSHNLSYTAVFLNARARRFILLRHPEVKNLSSFEKVIFKNTPAGIPRTRHFHYDHLKSHSLGQFVSVHQTFLTPASTWYEPLEKVN